MNSNNFITKCLLYFAATLRGVDTLDILTWLPCPCWHRTRPPCPSWCHTWLPCPRWPRTWLPCPCWRRTWLPCPWWCLTWLLHPCYCHTWLPFPQLRLEFPRTSPSHQWSLSDLSFCCLPVYCEQLNLDCWLGPRDWDYPSVQKSLRYASILWETLSSMKSVPRLYRAVS